MTPIPGCDFSAARPSVAQLKAAGMQFVIRYLKVLPNSYAISKAEFDSYVAAGIAVVLNWEQNESDWSGGYNQGINYASQARAQAEDLGAWPCAIYFSVDTGAFSAPSVVAYFQGIQSVMGLDATGIYGGISAVELGQAQGLASLFWQTYAWSSGAWAAELNLRQVPGSVPGFASDLDWAYTPYYGQVGAHIDPPAQMGDDLTMIKRIPYAGQDHTFAVDQQGRLVHRQYTGTKWTYEYPFTVAAGAGNEPPLVPLSTPEVVSPNYGDASRIDVYVPGTDGGQKHAWWVGGKWGWDAE